MKSTRPVVPGTEREHRERLAQAIDFMDLSPDAFRWHYLQMVFKIHNRNISDTARILGVHRRTLQRMLDKDKPKRMVQW